MVAAAVLADSDREAAISDGATASLGRRIKDILTSETSDAEGRDALDVMVVLADGDRLSGDEILDASLNIQRALYAAGDDRTAYVTYAVESDLHELGDHEDDGDER